MTACNGDSGAPGIVTQEDIDIVLAITANGDSHCRATNTMTRVDTQDFYNFLSKLTTTGRHQPVKQTRW
jgi:secreted trypsin-like serine protease